MTLTRNIGAAVAMVGLVLVGAGGVGPAPASAGEVGSAMNFCQTNCKSLYVQNDASALVLSVNVTESGTGCSGVKKRHTANLTGAAGGMDYFVVNANKSCRYDIKFNTTNGCVGDKNVAIGPGKIEDGEVYALLSGACGTLSAKSRKSLAYPSSH
jgi:hypothetical protein